MAYSTRPIRLALVATTMLSANWALAQSGGSFGGSFEPGAVPAQVTPPAGGQPPPVPGGDNFGGSFGTGGGVTPPPVNTGTTPPPAPPPVNTGITPPPAPPPDNTGVTPPAPPPDNTGTTPPQPPPDNFVVTPPPDGNGTTPPPEPPNGVEAFELRDFGVPPTTTLRNGQFHAPTPTSVRGGRIITTAALSQAVNAGKQMVVIDVLGQNYSLPGALMAPALASGGDFNDRIQQQAVQWLGQITRGDRGQAIVIYCSDPHCWLSYNATLRVVAAGYSNVYWYRGGLQAWQMAGLSLVPSGF